MSRELNIIIIDDDTSIIEILTNYLQSHSVAGFTSSIDGIESIRKNKYDLLILDYYVDDLNGSDIIKKIREFDKEIYILLLTGYSDSVPGIETLNSLDIQSYVEKTPDFKSIMLNIENAIKSIGFLCENNDSAEFKDRLKWLRTKFNISQETFAEYLGVKRSTVAGYEMGNSEPSYEILRKIARYFNVTTDYLLGYSLSDTIIK